MIINQTDAGIKPIAFKLNSNLYASISAKSWYDWCNSDLNTEGYKCRRPEEGITLDDKLVMLGDTLLLGNDPIENKGEYVVSDSLTKYDIRVYPDPEKLFVYETVSAASPAQFPDYYKVGYYIDDWKKVYTTIMYDKSILIDTSSSTGGAGVSVTTSSASMSYTRAGNSNMSFYVYSEPFSLFSAGSVSFSYEMLSNTTYTYTYYGSQREYGIYNLIFYDILNLDTGLYLGSGTTSYGNLEGALYGTGMSTTYTKTYDLPAGNYQLFVRYSGQSVPRYDYYAYATGYYQVNIHSIKATPVEESSVSSESSESIFTSNKRVAASWSPRQYSIIYYPNGGTGSAHARPFTYGTPMSISHSSFENEGYGFGWWNTKEDGTGISFYPSDDITTLFDNEVYEELADNKYIRLYAQWFSTDDIDYITRDFYTTDNGDGTRTLTGWRGTYQGYTSTELIIPDDSRIIL